MTDGATAWRTLAAHFRDRITSGELKSGVQLPTETQMQHVFEVSRTTIHKRVHKALRRLKELLEKFEREGALNHVERP